MLGAVGPPGASGQNSVVGDMGPQGPTGISASLGLTGSTGPSGYISDIGPTGLPGPSGMPILISATGPTGPTGDNATAVTGPTGLPGPSATFLVTGFASDFGYAGDFGDTGEPGLVTGATGPLGGGSVVGPTGDDSATGPTGPPGANGVSGAPAIPGQRGPTGFGTRTGSLGVTGRTGAVLVATGPAGLILGTGPTGPRAPNTNSWSTSRNNFGNQLNPGTTTGPFGPITIDQTGFWDFSIGFQTNGTSAATAEMRVGFDISRFRGFTIESSIYQFKSGGVNSFIGVATFGCYLFAGDVVTTYLKLKSATSISGNPQVAQTSVTKVRVM